MRKMQILRPLPLYTTYRRRGLAAWITCRNLFECKFPDVKDLKGVRICRQTDGVWTNEFVKSVHPRGGNYYWLTGSYRNDEPEAQDTDHWALDHGYVAITPTQIDVTAYTLMEQLNHWNWQL